MTDAARKPRYRLRLYIAGPGAYATRARQTLDAYATAAGIEFDLELIDLRQDPGKASNDGIVVTPTLVKLSPAPRAMVIGDLADARKMATALGAPLP
jgi:circadian clock protein KaiB